MNDAAAAGAFVKIVDVLGDQREFGDDLCQPGKRSMAAVRLALQYAHPAPFVPSPNERLVVSKRRRRGELLGVETRPESGQCVPEGRDAAFCRNAGTGHGDDALASFQQRRRFVEQGGGIDLVFGHPVDPFLWGAGQ